MYVHCAQGAPWSTTETSFAKHIIVIIIIINSYLFIMHIVNVKFHRNVC